MRYVARQPIFDREEKVFGYELLFRDGLQNAFHGDSDEASRATLDRSLLMGLEVLCDGRRAFVNCTRDTLIKGLVTLLPSTTTVVEILETVAPDPDVFTACRNLKEAGYLIALDDYVAGIPGSRGGSCRHHQSRNAVDDRTGATCLAEAVWPLALPDAGGKN
jgi:c-di-GMP-related signal transduction protein